MADITNVFKATVKTIRVREKNLGTVAGGDKSILPTCRRTKSEFTANAMEVVSKHLSSLLTKSRNRWLVRSENASKLAFFNMCKLELYLSMFGGSFTYFRVTLIAESSSNFAANWLKSAELAPMQHSKNSNYCRACYNTSDGQKLKRNYFITIAGTNHNPEP